MLGRIIFLLTLVFSLSARAHAQTPPDMFKDVARDHWAYAAIDSLRARGIVIGYPESYFRGGRTLTRYEFAVALDRTLPRVLGSLRGNTSDADSKPVRATPEELTTIRGLVLEFRAELASIGNNVQAAVRRIDQIGTELANSVTSSSPRLSGVSSPSTLSISPRNSLRGLTADRQDSRLGFLSSLGGRNALSSTISGARSEPQISAPAYTAGLQFSRIGGGYAGSQSAPVAADDILTGLQIRAPLRAFGREASLTIGRFSPMSGRPTDSTSEDALQLRIDGARLSTRFGSLAVEAFGGHADPTSGIDSAPINTSAVRPDLDPRTTPFRLSGNHLTGVSLGLGVRQLEGGHVRLTALEVAGAGGQGFNGVQALGADLSLRLTSRLTLMGDWGKTVPHVLPGDAGVSPFSSAYNAAVSYDAGSLNLTAGYRYVDPYYLAPDYWGRIGGWLNPTNIAGPTVRAAWDITPRFALNVGGEVYSAAREGANGGFLGQNDTITRALVGIRWNLSRSLETTFDWEGIFWDLEGARGLTGGAVPGLLMPGAGRLNPTEQYFTLGTGYSLTNNARLRFLYQVGTYDGKGLLLTGSGLGARNTFNLFTGQVAVRF